MSLSQARDVPTTCLFKNDLIAFKTKLRERRRDHSSALNQDKAKCGQKPHVVRAADTQFQKKKDSKEPQPANQKVSQGTAVTITGSDNTAPNLWQMNQGCIMGASISLFYSGRTPAIQFPQEQLLHRRPNIITEVSHSFILFTWSKTD